MSCDIRFKVFREKDAEVFYFFYRLSMDKEMCKVRRKILIENNYLSCIIWYRIRVYNRFYNYVW